MRDDDVRPDVAQQPAHPPGARHQVAGPHPGGVDQRFQPVLVLTIVTGAERDHPVDVAQGVELPCELERDELRTAPVAPGDQVHDDERRVAARVWGRPDAPCVHRDGGYPAARPADPVPATPTRRGR